MTFEIGKYYVHPTGEQMAIIGELETTTFGMTLIAESNNGVNFKAVGRDEDHAVNWKEISRDEWMKNFS